MQNDDELKTTGLRSLRLARFGTTAVAAAAPPEAPLFFAAMAFAFAASGHSFAEPVGFAINEVSLFVGRLARDFLLSGRWQQECEPLTERVNSTGLTSPLLQVNKHPLVIHSEIPIAITIRVILNVRVRGFITRSLLPFSPYCRERRALTGALAKTQKQKNTARFV